MSSKVGRRSAAATSILSFLAVLSIAFSVPASAGATGTSAYDSFTIPIYSITVPGGLFTHVIEGSGRTALLQNGVARSPQLCYPRVTFLNKANGAVTSTTYTAEHQGCKYIQHEGTRRNITWGSNIDQSCARILFAGNEKATHCHYIRS